MQAKNECVSCIFNQAFRVCENVGADERQTKAVLDRIGAMIKGFDLSKTPPAIAVDVYGEIAHMLGSDDLYKKQKNEATIQASVALNTLRQMRPDYSNTLLFAIKAAVIGNVIDLAAQMEFDLHEEIQNVFDTPFAYDSSFMFAREFEQADSILIIGDNAGEHIFDGYMIELFKELDPHKSYTFAPRSKPIINDLSYDEALSSPVADVARIVDSGVDTPGLEIERADDDFLQLLSRADLVIAKGMGNYESLAARAGRPVYHLLKVKCNVVAQDIRAHIGDIIFQKI